MPSSQADVDEHAPRPKEKPFLVALRALSFALLLAACVLVRIKCLLYKPFWFDETFSVEIARFDWRNFVHLLWWREANMSLYYLMLRIWLLLGDSPGSVRGFSVLMAAATLPAMFLLARQLYDERVAWIAAALFTFNAYNIRYAQEARSYALFMLLATLSSLFLITWLRRPQRPFWLGYIASSLLAVYAHFYALLLLVVHWLGLHWMSNPVTKNEPGNLFSRRLRSVRIAIGIGILPVLIFVAKTGAGPINWISRPGLSTIFEFYRNIAGGNSTLLAGIFAAACLAAIAPQARRMFGPDERWEVWRIQFLLVWLFFPVALTFVLSFARPVFLGRYMIFCLPALLVLAAAGLARLRPRWLLIGCCCAVVLLSIKSDAFIYGHDFDNERDASNAASNFILDHSQPGDALVFHIAETRVPYEFFRSLRAREDNGAPKSGEQLGPEIVFPRHGPVLDYRDFAGRPPAELMRAAASSHQRMWIMLMFNGAADHPDPATLMLAQLMPEYFPQKQSWKFSRVEVWLYTKP